MKLLFKLVQTVISIIAIFIFLGALLYINRNRLILPFKNNESTSQFENRKAEILNIISKNYIDKDITNQEDVETAELKGIVSSLQDPYSTYFSDTEYNNFQNSLDEKYEGIGIGFNQKKEGYIVTKVLSNSPAEKLGLKVDDIIEKVDNEEIKNLDFDKIGDKIRGKSGTSVKLTISRTGETIDFNVTRAPIANELVTLTTKNDIGIITITSFGNDVSSKFKEIVQKVIDNKNIKSIILDLRSNTGGLLNETVEIASYLQKPDQTVVIEQNKLEQTKLFTKQKNISLESYPIVILTDRYTASASEILAGSLRDNRSIKLIGQKTFGKGVVQSLFKLKNGDTLKLTIAKWLTPNGAEINKEGLAPDIKAYEGDDIIQKAIEALKNN
ncbi:MAG: S41 family peptidase [candidate division SR1 bacterium]|nr:S41 family peptidase [candidate division SR1 bacterium]